MIPCSNCKHFDTDYVWEEEYNDGDEYEVPICLKNMPLCVSDETKCEKQEPWKKQGGNVWKDYFENWED